MSIEVNATEQIIEVNATGSTIDINVTSQTVDVNATTSVIDVNVTNGPGPGVPSAGLAGQVLKKLSNADYDTYWAADTVGVPYVGATGNVDLGEFELKAGQIEFDQTPTGTAGVAVTRWNDTVGTIETTLKGGNVILRHGRDMFERVVNKTGIQLTKAAYQAVKISDAQGQRLAVELAQANNDNNSADTIGLVVETIDNNQEGYIYTVGELQNINTTGSLQGETWADGDVLYLSPTTAGRITNVKPVAPQHLVVIGYVVYAHQNNGKIFVKITNGFELGELHDVDTTGATSGQVLKYNGTIWTPSSDLDTGITSLNGLTALTQTFATGTSGTDFNISSATSTHTFNLPTASATNRGLVSSSDWSTFNNKENVLTFSSPLSRSVNTVSIQQATGSVSGFLSSTDWTTFNNKQNALTNPITGTGTTGQVAYWSGTNTQTGSNNLFWDNTNGRLGIGTNAPTRILHVVGGDSIRFERAGTVELDLFNSGNNVFLRMTSSSSSVAIGTIQNYPFNFWVNGTARAQLTSTNGNLILQNGGTFTDGGQRLQVQGDAFIRGSGNTSGSTALTVQNSDGTASFSVFNNGVSQFGINNNFLNISNNGAGTNAKHISAFWGGSTPYGIDIRTNISTDTNVGGTYGLRVQNPFGANFTSGNYTNLICGSNYSPTSGTGTYTQLSISGNINQTGGANGITRGLYVNPTLTAAADWRSIEWSNNAGWGLYGVGTSRNYLEGDTAIGTTTLGTATKLTLGGSETASSAIARGQLINTTLVAAANNDVLVGLDINPTFQTGAFTGVTTLPLRITGNTASLVARMSNSNSSALTYFQVQNSQGNDIQLAMSGSASTPFGNLITNMGYIYSNRPIGMMSNDANGYLSIATGGSTERMRLFQTGNLLLQNGGTFIDAGFRLDVNGSTRSVTFRSDNSSQAISGSTAYQPNYFFGLATYANAVNTTAIVSGTWSQINHQFNTSTISNATALTTYNVVTMLASGGTVTVTQPSYLNAVSSINAHNFITGSVNMTLSHMAGIVVKPILANAAGTLTVNNYYGLLINDTTQSAAAFSPTNRWGIYQEGASDRNYFAASSVFGSTSLNASAQVQVDSSTRGFLPPRMTTTQKNAIATPAAGLVVYDTTTNKLCCYNGTTWNDLF